MNMKKLIFFLISVPTFLGAAVLASYVAEAKLGVQFDRHRETEKSTPQDAEHSSDGGSSDEPRGPALFNMTRPHVGHVPYGGSGIIRTCANPGQVALTFDDGPWVWTERIMDELEKYRSRGTFFITGHNLLLGRKIDDDETVYPELLRDMRKRGHQIGSHTWTHQHLGKISHAARVHEMVYNEMALRNVLGVVPTYMRPPYAEWRDRDVRADLDDLGYHIVMYNIDTKDFLHNGRDDIQASIDTFEDAVSKEGDGSYVVLCHDIREWTAKKLVPAMLRTIRERGYEAVTLGECLNDPEEFWYRDPEAGEEL